MSHERFHFHTLEALEREIEELNLDLPVDRDLEPLARSVQMASRRAPNALAVQPMEGCDGDAEGRPGPLTERRYRRFARGGAGLLWFEATAIEQAARANPRQLMLTEENVSHFAALRRDALAAGREVNGPDYDPFTVLQLTHSGRYSRPQGDPAPIIPQHDGILDEVQGLPDDYPLISDGELDRLQDRYVRLAHLVRDCGFDGVDFKSCHRYLISELLASHTREGRYGGSFEDRTRFLLQLVGRVRDQVPDLAVLVRLNVYDGHPYPWGWGVSEDDPGVPDLTEPLRLVGRLKEAGVAAINVTAGNPYYTPHINRPFDRNVPGGYAPQEHPLCGVARLVHLARDIKKAHPDMVVVGSGYSWLRQYLGHVAAAVIRRGWADIVGLGREAFAYPDFARDLLTKGALDPRRVCITCSRCTQIMRDGGRTGCVPLDSEVYGPIYAQGRRGKR